jgi:hypothetical protein
MFCIETFRVDTLFVVLERCQPFWCTGLMRQQGSPDRRVFFEGGNAAAKSEHATGKMLDQTP